MKWKDFIIYKLEEESVRAWEAVISPISADIIHEKKPVFISIPNS
jgi:hypothetical protein